MIGKEEDVGASVPQGWQMDREDVEPKEKILPETPFFDLGLEVTVGRCYDSSIGFDGPVASNALKTSLLKDTQQFYLNRRGEIADFVEEKGTVHGRLKAPQP